MLLNLAASLFCALSWLETAQTPPDTLPEDAPTLDPIPTDNWGERRAALLEEWLDVIGDLPPRPTLTPQVLSLEVVDGDVIRERWRYEIEPGVFVEAYLCRPAAEGVYPAVVVFHSTVNHSILQPAGLAGSQEFHIGLTLAKQGYVTLSPRNFIWGDHNEVESLRPVLDEVMADFWVRHADWTGIGKMTWDGMVAVDLLCALPYVDASRLGCVGHSLGAKEALYLAAFDERIAATVSSEGGIGVAYSNWHDPWYMGDQVKAADFDRDHHELLALIAPRPFLLLGGESADGDRSWAQIEAARPVYEALGGAERLAYLNHRAGHALPPDAETALYEWLDEFLKR
ncbi:MAG: dienelactone hydrolase family protein [Candidatus Poribacteria bacterium]|nr:dienelactone hydrolase family protein [Candidatus Poribacteria bacterium]